MNLFHMLAYSHQQHIPIKHQQISQGKHLLSHPVVLVEQQQNGPQTTTVRMPRAQPHPARNSPPLLAARRLGPMICMLANPGCQKRVEKTLICESVSLIRLHWNRSKSKPDLLPGIQCDSTCCPVTSDCIAFPASRDLEFPFVQINFWVQFSLQV